MISVIIPAKNEPYLSQTMSEVVAKSRGEIEILVDDDASEGNNMRQKINGLVSQAKGEYLFKLDAHCMLDEGFDLKLIEAHQHDWVQIPRRKRLDAEKWMVIEDGRPPIDYESIVFRNLLDNGGKLKSKGFIWGTPWNVRRDELIDGTPHFQGSCWFMTKEWFNKCGFMDLSYGGFAQESEEILFTTLKKGGRVVTNKNTWYAHLHKDEKAREWFKLDSEDMAKGYVYSYNKWVGDKEFFEDFIKSYPPMPGWPPNWQRILWT